MGNQASAKPVAASDIVAFVKSFQNLKNVVWSKYLPLHGGRSHVVLLGEDHYLKKPTGSSRTFRDALKELRSRCDQSVDVFVEADVSLRPWVAKDDTADEKDDSREPIMIGVRHEMQLKRDCAQVRLHITDTRDPGIMQLLGYMRAGASLENPERDPMPLKTFFELTRLTLESVDHQVELLTKVIQGSRLTPRQSAVADRALSILDKQRRSPPVAPLRAEDSDSVARDTLRKRAEVSMDELTWLTDIGTALRILTPGRMPLIVVFGGYEHMKNLAQMLDPSFVAVDSTAE